MKYFGSAYWTLYGNMFLNYFNSLLYFFMPLKKKLAKASVAANFMNGSSRIELQKYYKY